MSMELHGQARGPKNFLIGQIQKIRIGSYEVLEAGGASG
jgi:hypothetical protein